MATRKNVNATVQVKEFNRKRWICTRVVLSDTTTFEDYDFIDNADGFPWKIIRQWKANDLDGIVIDDEVADPEGIPIPVPPPPVFQDTKSFYFDGTDEGMVSTSNYSNMDNANSYSVSFWVKLSVVAQGFAYQLRNPGETSSQLYCLIQNNGRVDVGTAGSGSNWSRSTELLTTGGWNHVCIVLKPSPFNRYQQQRIYINGQFGMTSNFSGNVGIGACGKLAFASSTTGTYNSNANFNEFAFWVNHDLTNAEIAQVYNNGLPNNLDEDITTKPTSWYREENATYNGVDWIMPDFYGVGPDMQSQNMEAISRQNDVPTQ